MVEQNKKLMTIDIYERAAGISFVVPAEQINPACVLLAAMYKDRFFTEFVSIMSSFKPEDVVKWKENGDVYFARGIALPYECAFNEIMNTKKNPYEAEERNRDVF